MKTKRDQILQDHVDKEQIDSLGENVWPDILEAMELYRNQPSAEGVKSVEDYLRQQNPYYEHGIGKVLEQDAIAALTAQARDYENTLDKIRASVAEYMRTEGCSCCQDTEGHKVASTELGRLLGAPMYSDNSGYDFSQFRNDRSKPKE